MWASLWRAALFTHHVPAGNDHPAPAARDPRRPGDEPTPRHASTAWSCSSRPSSRARSSSCCGSGCTTTRPGRSIISWSTRSASSPCRTRRNGWAARRSRCPRSRSWKCGGASATTRSSSSPASPRSRRTCRKRPRIDGANEWQVFWHVTRPRLAPIMMILVVLRFGTAMAVIDEYLIFGGFNRASPTYTWTIFMYDQAFKLGPLAAGLRRGHRHDRRGRHDDRHGRPDPHLPSEGLTGMTLEAVHDSAIHREPRATTTPRARLVQREPRRDRAPRGDQPLHW